MTTTSHPTSAIEAPSRTPLLAAAGLGASALLTAVGSFWDLTSNETRNGHTLGEWLISMGIACVVALLAFGLVVRTAGRGNPGRRSLVTGVVAALSFVVFWAGIPSVLAAASVACALMERDRQGSFSGASKAGMLLSALAFAAAVVLAVVG